MAGARTVTDRRVVAAEVTRSPYGSALVRLSRSFGLGGRRRVEGMVDVFNVFNHKNYGAYTLAESSAAYGTPTRINQIAYSARTVQLGFRVAF